MREHENENDLSFPLFSQSMFHTRYHRQEELVSLLSESETMAEITETEVTSYAMVDDIMEEEVDTLVLTDKQKYNKVMPLLLRLGNLTSVHGTRVFLNYFAELEEVEKRVRRGQKIIGNNNIPLEETNSEVDPENNEDEMQSMDIEPNEEAIVSVEPTETNDDSNRFQEIK